MNNINTREMKWYDYLFYKIYKLTSYLGNKDFYPESIAWFFSAMCIWLNMLAILNFTELKLGKTLTDKAYVFIFYVVYLLLTFIYFFRKERFKRIVWAYDKEDKRKKIWGTVVVSMYVIATLVFHFYFAEQRRDMALRMQH